MEIQWPLVFFTLLTGLGVGGFAVVAVLEWLGKAERARLSGAIMALVAVAAGGVASVFHLGHPERIFNALGHLDSGITQEMALLGGTGVAIVLYLVVTRLGYSAQVKKIVATIGAVLGVVLAFAMGASYVLPARPAWNTWLLPLLYVGSAAVLGLFSMYLWTVVSKEDKALALGLNKATAIGVAVQMALVAAYVIYLAVAPFQNPLRSAGRVLSGDLALAFWLGVVILGLLVPLGLTVWFLSAKRKEAMPSVAVPVVGLVCALLGGGVTRALMYILGSSIEQFF